MVESKPRVLITGISGFIGSQVAYTFLKHGGFQVRGTVRNAKNQEKLQPIREGIGSDLFDQMELVSADLMKEETIIEACKDCTYVVHVASPIALNAPKDPQEMIRPAVNGTLAALKGAQKYGVKRVAFTSSAYATFMTGRQKMMNATITEEDWSIPEICGTYGQSKIYAEKAAWEFWRAIPEHQRFEMVALNPFMVFGPSFIKKGFTSGDVLAQVMNGKFPSAPRVRVGAVDIREVAQAHLQAILVPEAANKRFILCSETMWFRDFLKKIHGLYGKDYKIGTGELSYCLIAIAALFNADAREARDIWGAEFTLDNKQARQVLGINFRPVADSLKDCIDFMIENGYIPDKRKSR